MKKGDDHRNPFPNEEPGGRQPELALTGSGWLGWVVSGLRLDLKQGVRSLCRSPGFSLIVVLVLALGIGSVTAIFSLINGILLTPPPYRDPGELVVMTTPEQEVATISGREYLDYRERLESLGDLAIYLAWTEGLNLSGYGEPSHASTNPVSANLFSVLGVEPLLGRTFTPEEDQPGGERVMILAHGFWERQFGADPSIVGRTILMSDEEYRVVGVMPSSFAFPSAEPDIWVPLRLDPVRPGARRDRNYGTIGRLRPGVEPERASLELERITGQLVVDYSQDYPENSSRRRATAVARLQDAETRTVRSTLFLLWGAGFLVLLIAVINVCTLLLLRGANRQKSLAVRAALGASRSRMTRQLTTEYLLLFLASGIAGWGFALLFLELGINQIPAQLQLTIPALDPKVAGFGLLASLLLGLVFGTLPALQSSSLDLNRSLRSGGRRSSGDQHSGFRHVLVIGQIALSLILLIGAGLFLQTFVNVLEVEWGVATGNVQIFRIWPPASRYPGATELRIFYSSLLDRIRSVPGVEAAGAAAFSHLTAVLGRQLMPEGFPPNVPEYSLPFGVVNTRYRQVTPGYFETLEIGLLAGRYFDDRDIETVAPVVIVDEEFARTAWPGESNVVGRRVAVPDLRGGDHQWATLVGVVEHTRDELRGARNPQSYHPAYQTGRRVMHVAFRSAGNPTTLLPLVRSELAQVDSQLPIYQVMNLAERLDQRFSQLRFVVILVGVFASMALVVTLVGLYGVLAYNVSQRTHEFGVRLALGASRNTILQLVLEKGLRLTFGGIVVGLLGAIGVGFTLTRVWDEFLYGVHSMDTATYALVSVVLVTVSLLAGLIPAFRATRVDPLQALRSE